MVPSLAWQTNSLTDERGIPVAQQPKAKGHSLRLAYQKANLRSALGVAVCVRWLSQRTPLWPGAIIIVHQRKPLRP